MNESVNSSTTDSTESPTTSSTSKTEPFYKGLNVTLEIKLASITLIWVAAIFSPHGGTCLGAFFATWFIVEL